MLFRHSAQRLLVDLFTALLVEETHGRCQQALRASVGESAHHAITVAENAFAIDIGELEQCCRTRVIRRELARASIIASAKIRVRRSSHGLSWKLL